MMASSKLIFFILSVFSVCGLDNSPPLPTQKEFLEQLNITESKPVKIDDFGIKIKPKHIKFLLYSSTSNETTEIAAHELLNSKYPTKIIIHGFLNNAREPWIREIAFLYHQKGSYNVIAVDWSKYTSAVPGYQFSALAVQKVGLIIGDFLLNLEEHIPKFLQNLHIIGHSLGAHVAGFAGKRVVTAHKDLVNRITGLDAAGPLFESPSNTRPPHLRLDRSDADVVDLIHTNIGFYGMVLEYGKSDFYVNNGGPRQPGCITNICSHNYAHVLFADTIKNPTKYEGVSCLSSILFDLGVCKGNPKAFMGDELTADALGPYYLKA